MSVRSAELTEPERARLVRLGQRLEIATLGWNVIGVVILAVGAISAGSVALAGFGLDSLIEIAASTVVLWELADASAQRQRRALAFIAWAFLFLAGYLVIQTSVVFAVAHHPRHSPLGIAWTAATALIMFALARGKQETGQRLGNQVLLTESRVTVIDGLLATSVLLGLVLNSAAGWWWADPAAGLVIVYYAVREALAIRTHLA